MPKGWPPPILTPVTKLEQQHGDGDRAVQFIEHFCRITKDSIGGQAGHKTVMHPWQRSLLRHLLARQTDGRYKHRQALIGIARKNGKSSILSGLGLFALYTGAQGGEVYQVATTKDQARIVFGTAKRIIEMDPDLSKMANLYKDAIELPKTGSVMRPLAAEAPQLEGLNPTFIVYDELHTAPNRELWDVLSLATGARREPMMVAITTAGRRTDASGNDSLAYRMYQYARQVASGEVTDPTFFAAWWQPKNPEDADHKDSDVWKHANPGYVDLIDPADFEAAVQRTPEAEFKTKRLNMWVDQINQWIPLDKWEACQGQVELDHEKRYVLGVDASFSGDSTAIVAVSVEDKPQLILLHLWERPANTTEQWRVDPLEIESAITEFCRTYSVSEVCYDPYRMQRSAAVLAEEGIPMVEFPQSPSRMVPATGAFYEAVMTEGLVHPGELRLTRHIQNAAVKNDPRGTKIVKSAYTKKIDAAVACIMAFSRAQWHSQQPAPKARRAYGF